MVISKYKLITQPPYKKGKEAQMTKKPHRIWQGNWILLLQDPEKLWVPLAYTTSPKQGKLDN